MPKVKFLPTGRCIEVRPGTTLFDAGRRAHVPILTRCNGMASCLMCRVKVAPDQAFALEEPGPVERRKMGSMLPEGIRLSCQAKVVANVVVTVPEDPLKEAVRKQLKAQQRERDELW